MKHIFIINPTAGKAKGKIIGDIINNYCKEKEIDYKIIYTTEKGEAKYLALMNSQNGNIIYSVGGDGTINEIVNGLVHSDAILSIVPVGSGNDFYKSSIISDSNIIDLGKVNDKYFINVASLGLDAEIAKTANELKEKGVPNKLIYIDGILYNLFKFDKIDININDKQKNLTILAICNGRYYGGGFCISPDSKLDDGLFDVIEANSLRKIETIKLLYKLLKKNHLSSDKINFYKTNNVNVSSDLPLVCNIDGEIVEGKSFDFKLEKDALKINNDDNLEILKLLKHHKILK